MFPLRDDNPTELTPWVTILVIGLCVAAWILVQGGGMNADLLGRSVCSLGAVPARITGAPPRGPAPCTGIGMAWPSLLTSMFLHGGWLHLIGNMWFLWIFGNNVEDSMGHVRFAVFYVLTGLVAAGAHVVTAPGSAVPMVGASGAISGIMGAYLVLYPRARIRTLLILVIFITLVDVPAFVFLGYWFLLQAVSSQLAPGVGGGVAFTAHLGGFLAGVVLILFFRDPRLVAAKRAGVRLRAPETSGQRPWDGGWS